MGTTSTSVWAGMDNIHRDSELTKGQDGSEPLRSSVNLDFTATGRALSRVGRVQLASGAASHGFAYRQFLIYLQGGYLMAMNVQTGVVQSLAMAQGSHIARVIAGDNLYLSDGASKWMVTPSLDVTSWPMPAADDPTFDMRFLAPFPAVTNLCLFQGRMVGAVDNAVVYSEPYAYGVWNSARNFFTVPAKVGVLYTNQDSLFVGAENIYAVNDLGLAKQSADIVLGVPSPDVEPAVDAESGVGYWPTTRGLVTVPFNGTKVELTAPDRFAVRAMSTAAVGVLKREGMIQVVATSVHDSSQMLEHPLISKDFLNAEAIRKELQNAL